MGVDSTHSTHVLAVRERETLRAECDQLTAGLGAAASKYHVDLQLAWENLARLRANLRELDEGISAINARKAQ